MEEGRRETRRGRKFSQIMSHAMKHTCRLLYLLKVLPQTGHENCVGPTRIWVGVGIQYCPLLKGYPETALPFSPLSVTSADGETLNLRSELLGLGRPMCRATVTASSSTVLEKRLSSLLMFLSSSTELLEGSFSSCPVGLR